MLLWKLLEAEHFCFKIKTAVFKVTKPLNFQCFGFLIATMHSQMCTFLCD